ncbi:14160_t:CDS:2 [Gigaspora rosea]|nr:14160_t:CDS:2 [Gigaspora rosea]
MDYDNDLVYDDNPYTDSYADSYTDPYTNAYTDPYINPDNKTSLAYIELKQNTI